MLVDAEINISEAVDILSKYIISIDFDRDKSSFLEEKINAIHTISRKHKVEPNNLVRTHEDIKNELEYLRDSEASIIKIEEKISESKKLYDKQAKELESLNLRHNEYDDLNKEFKKISNTEKISKGVNTLIGNLQTNEINNACPMINLYHDNLVYYFHIYF